MKILANNFRTYATAGQPFVLTADSFSGQRTATHAAYVDNRPLLAAGKPETRQYKAVFFIGKSEIGLPSAVVIAIAAP
jgi:hypothetical protein